MTRVFFCPLKQESGNTDSRETKDAKGAAVADPGQVTGAPDYKEEEHGK